MVIHLPATLAGSSALELEAPREDKRLLVIAQTNGCFLAGLEVATSPAPGRRTLRIVDYGKVAASFADPKTDRALRVSPHLGIRQRALLYTPCETHRYYAVLQGYQVMSDEEPLSIQENEFHPPVDILVGRNGVQTTWGVWRGNHQPAGSGSRWRTSVPQLCWGRILPNTPVN